MLQQRKEWTITLVVESPTYLGQIQETPLFGILYRQERVLILFAANSAPPGAHPIGRYCSNAAPGVPWLCVVPNGDGLVANGFPLEHEAPVRMVTFDDVFARTPFQPDHIQQLFQGEVLKVGLGSVGSPIAKSLVRGGVGKLILADPDRFSIENVFRHECSMLDVGRFKVDAIAESCRQVNPNVSIRTFSEDIFKWPDSDLGRLLKDVSVIVDSTDRQNIRLTTARWGHELNIPVVHGGCFEEARGGEVFWHVPGKEEPCYWCLREGMAEPPKSKHIDYSTAQGPDDYEGEPGLDAVTKGVAMAAVQITMAILLRDVPNCRLSSVLDSQSNYLLIGNASSNGFYRFRAPFHSFFQPFKGPRKNCSLCQPKN